MSRRQRPTRRFERHSRTLQGSLRRRSSFQTRGRFRGAFTIIEALVAGVIMTLGVAAMVSMWYFAFHMTTEADNLGVAYTLGRHEMERVKQTGFDYSPSGVSTVYFNTSGYGEHATKQTGDVWQVTTTITNVGNYPSYDAYRQVQISVTYLTSPPQTLYKTGTILAKQGI